MDENFNGRQAAGRRAPSFTTRRSFLALTSLGAVSLYGQWAALGAAPLRFWEAGGSTGGEMKMEGSGHDEHGGGAAGNTDEFRKVVEKFIEDHKQPDGSVLVDAQSTGTMPGMTMDASMSTSHDVSAMAGMSGHSDSHDTMNMPPEVYLLAQQWSFEPAWLKLRAGVAYKLKLMAADAAHGASLQLGPAGQIIRLPKGVPVERQFTFTTPGSYLLYCTVYCGEGHQYMSGKLEIV